MRKPTGVNSAGEEVVASSVQYTNGVKDALSICRQLVVQTPGPGDNNRKSDNYRFKKKRLSQPTHLSPTVTGLLYEPFCPVTVLGRPTLGRLDVPFL